MSRAHTKGSALHWQAPPALQQESAETLMTMDLNLKSTTLPERNIESQCDSGGDTTPNLCQWQRPRFTEFTGYQVLCAFDSGRKVKRKTNPLIRKDAAKDCFVWNSYYYCRVPTESIKDLW